ncbi:peroxidase A2-like [Wolffia australiana]
MVRMGAIGVLTGNQGEIRVKCSVVNSLRKATDERCSQYAVNLASPDEERLPIYKKVQSGESNIAIASLRLELLSDSSLSKEFGQEPGFRNVANHARRFVRRFVLAVHSLSLVAATHPSRRASTEELPAGGAHREERCRAAVAANPGIGRGCDASVLLEGSESEQTNIPNPNSLRRFEATNEAKPLLESRISLKAEADVLPSPFAGAAVLGEDFRKKGMSLEDMVVLSGAHSLGIAHCPTFSRRLYAFNATHPQDPSMDAGLAEYLKRRCPPPGRDPTAVPLDVATPNLLSMQYYRNLKAGKGVLISDQTLWTIKLSLSTSSLTANLVNSFAQKPNLWAKKYADAMVRMGAIDVLTGNQGEIRVKCSVVNSL